MYKQIQKQLLLLITVLGLFFLVPQVIFYAYAQVDPASESATGCALIDVGKPPANEQLPAGCSGNGSESAIVQKVIALALAHYKTGTYYSGTPSRDWAADKSTGLDNPPNFDCSGFTGWVWYWGSGGKISMAGQTNADWADTSNPHYDRVVTSNQSLLQPGDLIYFNNGLDEAQPGHTGLFIGKGTCGANDCFLQYYSTGKPGDELSLKAAMAPGAGWGSMMGFIRIKNP